MKLFFAICISTCLFTWKNVNAQKITHQSGMYGLSDENSKVILDPVYDGVIAERYMPTFFTVKMKNMYAFIYKVDMDSVTLLNEDQAFWKLSDFEFDSLRCMSIGVDKYFGNFGYACIAYKKSRHWGIIYIQTYTSSGNGIFPSAGFNADRLGKLYRTEAKYDNILKQEEDNFFTTLLNGKYGLWNPIKSEEYTPVFDSIPVYNGWPRERYVKIDAKWGAIMMEEKTKTIVYNVPCQCNKVIRIYDVIYACGGYDDTITFFNSLTHTSFTPLYDNKSLVFNNDTVEITIDKYTTDNNSDLPIFIGLNNSDTPLPKYEYGFNRLYYVELSTEKIISYSDSGKYYVPQGAVKNGLIAKCELNPKGTKRVFEFYNIKTNEFRFAFELDTNLRYDTNVYYIKDHSELDGWYIRYSYLDTKRREHTIGYYSYQDEKFTRRKPKYRPIKN